MGGVSRPASKSGGGAPHLVAGVRNVDGIVTASSRCSCVFWLSRESGDKAALESFPTEALESFPTEALRKER